MLAGSKTVQEDKPAQRSVRDFPWITIAWFTALLIAVYLPVLDRLVRQWATDEDMGHGFFVPVIAGMIVWQRRDELLATVARPTWWGLVVVGWGAVQLYLATLGGELFLARTAFLFSLIGVVLFLGGIPILRKLAFPLFLLFFMVPIPSIIYNQITFPLQMLASRIAEQAIAMLGIPVFREGNILELSSQRLSVVEACSGIRSLLTLSFLALVYAYFFDKKVWMRAVLLVATVPIAIAANAGRVTITGVLSEINPELAEGLMHTASGWVIFMIALVILIATHTAINIVYKRIYGRA